MKPLVERTTPASPRRRQFCNEKRLRLMVSIAILLMLGWSSRNMVARHAGVLIGSRILGTRIDIGKVNIRWSAISVNEITVYEPRLVGEQQLSIKRVRIVPSLWQGLRTGVWLAELAVAEPTVQIRFDHDGNLLSSFPKGGGQSSDFGPLKLPIAKLLVIDAAFKVHQIGRQSLHVDHVRIGLVADKRIKAVMAIPNLLGGQMEWRCDVDALTLAGSTSLDLEDLHLDSRELVKLPLVPAELDSERATMDVGFRMTAQHPAHEFDLRRHNFHLQAWTANLHLDRIETLCERFDLEVRNDSGQISLNGNANPLAGHLTFAGSANLMSEVPQLVMQSSLRGCFPKAIREAFPNLATLEANAVASTEWSFTLAGSDVQFEGKANANVTDCSFTSIAMPVVTCGIDASGRFAVNNPSELHGTVKGMLQSDPFDLTEIANRVGICDTAGQVMASSEFMIPLASLTDVDTYVATAKLSMTGIAVSELHMDDALVDASLQDGRARVDVNGFSIRDKNGSLLADCQSSTIADLRKGGRAEFNAQLSAETSPELSRILGLQFAQPSGRLWLTTSASCDVESATDPAAWQANARVQTRSLAALGEIISDIDWRASLEAGKIACSPLVARWRDHAILINASGHLGSTFGVQGDLLLDSIRLRDLSDILSRYSNARCPVDGFAKIQGQFSIAFDPRCGARSLDASGTASLSNAQYADVRIGTAGLTWTANLDGLELNTSSADFLGGRFNVSAHMNELDWTRTVVEGRFSGTEVSRMVALTRQMLPTTGTLDGGFSVTSIASIESLCGDAWLRSQQLSVQKVPCAIDQVNLEVDQGQIAITGTGSVADGAFSGQANASLAELIDFLGRQSPRVVEIPISAQVKLTGLRAESLIRPLGVPREAQGISAGISAECVRTRAAFDGRHLCLASATVEDLRYNHGGLSQRVSFDTVLHDNRAELTGIRGRLADGVLSGTGVVRFEQTLSGRFDVAANRVNLRRATSPFGVNDISGSGTIKARGRIGPVITGQLDASVDHVAAAGVAIRSATFPVDWSFRPNANVVRWQCRAGTVAIGGGNMRIASEGSYTSGLSTTTSLRIERLDIAKLMQRGSVGSGVIDGQANLRANNARTVKDLVGSFGFEMQNIQAMQIPLLDQLPKMIALSPPVPGRGQDGGIARGRISGGMVHLDELAIHQSNVQVLVTGNATITGKLNLDVVASTESEGPTEQLLSLMDSPLMLAAPAPVGLIVKANDLLKDRVVRVHVGGTADRPTLRLQPGKQLSQDAVRFFLSSSLGPIGDQLSDAQSRYRRR